MTFHQGLVMFLTAFGVFCLASFALGGAVVAFMELYRAKDRILRCLARNRKDRPERPLSPGEQKVIEDMEAALRCGKPPEGNTK